MITKIILELVAGGATLLFGHMYWSVHRRKRLIRMIFDNPQVLARVVTSKLLRNPPFASAFFVSPELGASTNMVAFLAADQIAQRRGQILFFVLTIGIILTSGLLGIVCFIINLLLFFLLLLVPAGRVARGAAVNWVQTLAILLWRWHELNPNECAASVAQMGAPDMVILHSCLLQEELEQSEVVESTELPSRLTHDEMEEMKRKLEFMKSNYEMITSRAAEYMVDHPDESPNDVIDIVAEECFLEHEIARLKTELRRHD